MWSFFNSSTIESGVLILARIINLKTISDDRGSLSVIEKDLPFRIKRVYFMYNLSDSRGGHGHKKTIQALISVSGSCKVHTKNKNIDKCFILDRPDKCLIVNPEDWHIMDSFTADAVLLVLASEYYNSADYIT
jgi:hypothetical protein